MHPALDVAIQGKRVQAHTLDLNAPWEDLRAQLESHLATLGKTSHQTSEDSRPPLE